MAIRLGIIILLLLSACKRQEEKNPEIKRIYEQLQDVDIGKVTNVYKPKTITISAYNMPFKDFLRQLTRESGVSVIAQEGYENNPVTLDVVDAPVDQVITLVARRLGINATGSDGLFYMGDLKPEDKGYLVMKIPRLNAKQIEKTVQVLLGEYGRVVVMPDGLTIVADRVEVINRVRQLLFTVNNTPGETWVVQLHIISINHSDAKTLGINLDHTATASYSLSKQLNQSSSRSANSSLLLNATLDAVRTKQNSKIIANPTILLLPGETAKMHQGERTPVRQQSVSPEGTVTTTGFDFIETGLQIELELLNASRTDQALLDVDFSLSQIAGFVANEAPIVVSSSIETKGYINNGGVYLLGSMVIDSRSKSTSGPYIPLVRSSETGNNTLQLWAVAYQIQGPLVDSVAQSEPRLSVSEDTP